MKIKKILPLLLSCSLICCSLTACTEKTEDKQSAIREEETQVVEQVVAKLVNSGTSEAKKQETVYVKTNADGTVDSVIVSNWLRNTDNTSELTDETELSNIVNVKGKEDYTQNGTSLVWNAEGSDIYYQGTTDKELPVSVNVTYELDGKQVTAAELAGKSGHLVLTMNYVNNETNTVLVNGEEETIYTPFVCVTGMVIDPAIFSNVSVTNGSVISDGTRDIVVGMAFPGLVESLNGGNADSELMDKIEEEINIPCNVIVEADVTDFEMGMTLTMVNSDVSKALGFDELKLDSEYSSEDIQEKVDEFSSAGAELAEGTGSLKDGAEQLHEGSKSLTEGTENLQNGIVTYTEGVAAVASGVGEVNEGVSKLDAGVSQLENGVSQVSTGASKLETGASQVNSGAKQLKDGADSALTGANSVASGASELATGVNALAGQFSDIAEGVGAAYNGASQISAGINGLVTALQTTTSEDDIDVSGISVSGALSDEQLAAVITLVTSNMSDEALMENYGLTAEQVTAVKAMVSLVLENVLPGVTDEVATNAAKSAAKTAGAKASNETKAMILAVLTTPQTEGGVSLQTGASQLASSLYSSYIQLTSEEARNKLIALTTGAENLSNGAAKLATGVSSLKDGADSLYAGTTNLSEGCSQLNGGIGELSTGVSTLKAGTSALSEGSAKLANGAGELNANSAALVEGAGALASGSAALEEGIQSLVDGTIKLNDGMIQFNEEGISKLTELFNTDLASMSDRIKAISEAGKNYTTFAGSGSGEDCSVKFIIETAEVK